MMYHHPQPNSTKYQFLSNHSFRSRVQKGSWRGTRWMRSVTASNFISKSFSKLIAKLEQPLAFFVCLPQPPPNKPKWYFQSDCISTASNWAAIISCSRGGALFYANTEFPRCTADQEAKSVLSLLVVKYSSVTAEGFLKNDLELNGQISATTQGTWT